MDESKVCEVCADFEPQAWRKSLCRNCFHSLEEHSEDMLAAEAEAAAKEKADDKKGSKGEDSKSKRSGDAAKKGSPTDSKDAKGKSKMAPPAASKPPSSAPPAGKGKVTPPSSSTTTSSSSSSSSQISKPSLNMSPSTGASKTSSSTSLTSSSSSSSLSSTTAASPSTSVSSSASSSSSSGPRTSKPSQSTPSPAPTQSKAKSLTSKFEAKTSETKDLKSTAKPSSISGLKSKSDNSSSSVKKEDSESTSKSPSKLPSKSGGGNDLKKVGDVQSKKPDTTASQKDKSDSSTPGKGGKEPKIPVGRSKNVAPFGKDMLKSTKDTLKKDKEKEKDSLEQIGVNDLNNKDKGHGVKSKPDSPKKDNTTKDETKKKSPEKSDSPDKSKTLTSSNESKIGSLGKSTQNKSTDEKSGQGKAQRVESTGKVAEDHETSRSTREIDKVGASKAKGEPGQGAKTGAGGHEKEGDKRRSSTGGGDEDGGKGDNLKQQAEKSGKTGEREGKEGPASEWQVGAKGKFQSGPNHAAEPSTRKGLSGSDEASRDAATRKASGIDERKSDSSSVSSTSNHVCSTSLSSTSNVSVVTSKSSTSSPSSTQSSAPHSTAKPTAVEKDDENGKKESNLPRASSSQGLGGDKEAKKLSEELKKKDEKVAALESKLSAMERKLKVLEDEQESGLQSKVSEQKGEMEKLLKGLRDQLGQMEKQCSKLETDNTTLTGKLQEQEKSVKRDQEAHGKTDENTFLQEDLERTEIELDEVKEENSELKREIMEMKNEMDEMYDTFRENEHDEFRELQKELDMTAKNCRILQFKLRKAERRNEQIEEDRIHYEDKLRHLQDQFDSADAKNHIRVLEEELRMAKEVSVRLHDELDIIEDKKIKALEDNKHLTELLEHTDKRQFRMEMEIDKLRELVGDLKQQLKEARSKAVSDTNYNNNDDSTGINNPDASPDRKMAVGSLTSQTSRDNQDYDVSQLMKDLCDTMERENDLKDQLKFTEEEAKMMRRRVTEMDDENESLRLQLKKMSEKASRHKKQEQKRVKELEEERKVSEAVKAALTRQQEATDVAFVLAADDSDVMTGDEPIPITERKDSTDEDLMNVMQLRVHLEMLEQELMSSHKKLDDMDLENENLHDEVKFLQQRLDEQERSQDSNLRPPEPSSPNAYYEDKIKELTLDVDELRWKLIEKDREIERLSVVQTRHSRDHGHAKRSERLKKSKSLDTDNDPEVKDLRSQVEQLQMEVIRCKKEVEVTNDRNEELTKQFTELSKKPVIPQVEADGAAIENIELRDQVKKLEASVKEKSEKMKLLADDLQKLSRDSRTFQNIATSPMTPGSPSILNIPPSWPESLAGARAKTSAANQLEGSAPRDAAITHGQLLALQEENLELRRQMADLRSHGEPRGEADGSSSAQIHPTSPPSCSSSTFTTHESTAASFVVNLEEQTPAAHARISELSPSFPSALPRSTEKDEEEKSAECCYYDDDEEGERIVPCSNAGKLSSSLQQQQQKKRKGNENSRNAEEEKRTGQSDDDDDSIEEKQRDSIDRSLLSLSTTEPTSVIHLDSGSLEINKSDKTAKGQIGSSPKSRDMATVTKDANSGHQSLNIPDDGGGDGGDGQSSVGTKSPRTRSLEDDIKKSSILSKYPDGKSQVVVNGEESRVELMEKILDMDDEIGELISCIRKREDEYSRMCRDVKVMKAQMAELRDDSRRNERELLQELDMLHDKNTVMSNLLDIINERAEAAEEELERRIQEGTTASPPRSASNVSQVSALSDTSMGSDEVFLNAHGNKEGVITRDWEAKLKTRIESLERLLAEERQKVVTAEKKLILSAPEGISPSVSDDVKLRLREKELLQEELVESQRHLRIATDQIQGLKERLAIVDEEHQRLKLDYGKLYDEIDKPINKEVESGHDEGKDKDIEKDENEGAMSRENSIDSEHPFLAKKISVVEAPKLKELTALRNNHDAEVDDLKAELANYKSKCEELECKVEEINDIWRSKSAASDREKDDFEAQLKRRLQEIQLTTETLENLKRELCSKDKAIAEYEIKLKEKQQELDRRSETIKNQENEIKKREQDQQLFANQVSQRDGSIRSLNDTIRVRDERLKEKDDILFKLNSRIEEIKNRLKAAEQRNSDLNKQREENEAMLSRMRSEMTSQASPIQEGSRPSTCDTDAEKECARLSEAHNKLKEALKKAEAEKQKLQEMVEKSRQTMDESMVLWKNEKASLQHDLNVLEEKVRMYEVYNTQTQGEAVESLKVEAHGYFKEKEHLKLQLESVEVKAEADERTHQTQVARFQSELTEKLRLLKHEVEKNTRLALENERLSVQAEKAYRYQQEERVLKAEHQALKVRYEARFDKMYKEYNKMVAVIETLQREKDQDQEIIQSIQKNMNLVKDKYTDELLRAEDDKATLGKQMKEIDELRSHLDGLMKIVRELQDKASDQERLRAELINKMATDKASWEIERANLNSHVNQLEEQLSVASRQQNRAKDIQVNMGITWEKERKEQKRLLAEAHTLALDLQEQLRARDEAFAHERKELLRQMEGDRLAWTKEKRETEKRMTQFESNARKLVTVQKRLLESQEAVEVESRQWKKERQELVEQLGQSRQARARDCKRIEDVLAGLVQLRELGSLLEPQTNPNTDFDEKFILHVKQVVSQINKAAEELSGPSEDGQRKDSIASLNVGCYLEKTPSKIKTKHDDSESIIPIICLTSEKQPTTSSSSAKQNDQQKDLKHTVQEKMGKTSAESTMTSKATSQKPIPKLTTSNTIAQTIGKLQTSPSAKSTTATTAASKGAYTMGPKSSTAERRDDKTAPPSNNDKSDTKRNKPKLELDTRTWPRKPKPPDAPQLNTAPVTMRPFDFYSRRYERPPSYTSGTRSAQSSRAATPEVSDSMTNSAEFTPSKKTSLPEPPPCFILPHHSRSGSISPQRSSPSPALPGEHIATTSERSKVKRPTTFSKSLSVDSSDVLVTESPHRLVAKPRTSSSAATTPTQDSGSSDRRDFPSGATSGTNYLSLDSATSKSALRSKKCSPRTARKQFFAETPPATPESQDVLTWPDRKPLTNVHRPAKLPDPIELRREAEEEYVSISSKHEESDLTHPMKSSVSFDDTMHFHVVDASHRIPTGATPENSEQFSMTVASSTLASPIPEDAELLSSTNQTVTGPPPTKSAKEKRKFFKKSGSLDSTVGSSIAKMGVSAMPMAAPTGFTPYDFFAAVKGKLKPVFRQKSTNAKAKDQDGRSPSPLFIPTEVPDINFGNSGSTLLPVPVPQVNFRELEREEEEESISGHTSARSRHFHREGQGHSQPGKWRSKSADRAASASRGRQSHTTVTGSTQEIWKFNETDL